MSTIEEQTPTKINPPGDPPDFLRAALFWYHFGFPVIPIVPEEKRPTLPRQPWLEELSPEKTEEHWTKYPKNEVAIIVPEGFVVLDADSPKAISALENIETSHNVTPNLVVQTRRGVHHYFRLADGVYAPSDTHDSEKHPDRIDVLGKGRQVIVPPSTGKKLKTKSCKSSKDLVPVDQNFINSVFLMNDRSAPCPPDPEKNNQSQPSSGGTSIDKLQAILDSLDPDCSYEDWTKAIMAIFHETGGSDDGLALVDAWSSNGTKYQGRKAIEDKWKSLRLDIEKPITIGTLIKMARDAGADVKMTGGPSFEKCETRVVHLEPYKEIAMSQGIVFDQFSLTGYSAELALAATKQIPIIGNIVLLGQANAWYGEANSGKTLVLMKLITESVDRLLVRPEDIYYLNMDDDSQGLVTKLRIAEEFGFHMLAEGHKGFKISSFLNHIKEMTAKNQASGKVIVLDTLKKFVNPMNKNECREFSSIIRPFIAKGGTLIALAHTNKKKGNDGKPIYSGTSDIKDDFDCVYILSLMTTEAQGERVVLFENEKRRGNVPSSTAFSYSSENNISYEELFLSVRPFDESTALLLKKTEQIKSDTEIIEAIEECINHGINTKMNLAIEASQRVGISRKAAISVIERYTGDDPLIHRWNFTVKERGKQVFSVLNRLNNQQTHTERI